jgi:hypothetical protein
MNSPKGSCPVRLITALRRPWRAAATDTFVALPPRYLPNVCTSRSDTPVCSGYTSTPMRPMVSTSNPAIRLPFESAFSR